MNTKINIKIWRITISIDLPVEFLYKKIHYPIPESIYFGKDGVYDIFQEDKCTLAYCPRELKGRVKKVHLPFKFLLGKPVKSYLLYEIDLVEGHLPIYQERKITIFLIKNGFIQKNFI